MKTRVDSAWARWSLVLALAASAGLAEAQTAPPAKSAPAAVAKDAAQVAKPAPEAQASKPDAKPAKSEPALADILAQVSERHPDVLVAEARVREAEALLLQARLSLAHRAAASYQQRKSAESRLAEMEKMAAQRVVSAEQVSIAKASLAIAEAESPYSFLDSTGIQQFMLKSGAGLRQQPLPASRAAVDPSKFPRGPAVDTVRRELSRQISVDFNETPLADVVEFLHTTGVTILLDSERGVEPDQPMNLALTEAPLGSALLAIEDLYRPLRFVVRDYGLLLTTEDAIGEDTVSLRDYWKHANDEAAREKRP